MPTDHQSNRDKISYSKLAQDFPDDYIDQGRIIDKLNGYLAWHHFPIRMDNEGVCSGLSMVYAKYVLEGRAEEFKKMLHLISGDIQPESESDNALNHFAVEVVLTQSPRQFEKELSRNQSIQCLTIDGERLNSAFNFAITTKNENWAEIISALDLREDEPMLISSKRHCICVTKKDGRYTVYDPNYRDGFRYFENSTILVEEFHKCFSEAPEFDKPLCLEISVIRHPSLENPRMPLFPTAISLYEKYLTHHDAKINDTLLHAACVGDEMAIHKLIALGATEFQKATTYAILTKNVDTLCVLLHKIIESDPSYIAECFHSVLFCGSEDIMNIFTMMCSADYEAALDIDNIHRCVFIAAGGGNHRIIATLLSDARKLFCQKNGLVDNPFNEKKINDTIAASIFEHADCIKVAIESNSSESIQILMSLADSSSFAFSEEEKIEYLLLAIRTNKTAAVKQLITEISPDAIKSLTMSTNAVERTEFSILRQLKDHGFPFSNAAEGIIKKREHQIIDFGLNISIIFRKFTDYLLEMICQDAGVNINTQKLRLFKKASSPKEGAQSAGVFLRKKH